ncbi:Fe2+-dependent dioxygenase [Thiomicrorhabdus hydrogeniphila]
MISIIEQVLTQDEVAQFRQHLDSSSEWQDGLSTAGTLSGSVKRNLQINESSDIAVSLGNHILTKLGNNPDFISAALPNKIYPPKFNCYQDGGYYGEHVDSAIMQVPGTNIMIRSDLSATLFLSEPEDYAGGELVIEDQYGAQQVKLKAGDMVLYPSSSLHHVTPVTEGARISSFFWMQSLIKEEQARTMLYDLDQSIQSLSLEKAKDDSDLLRLTGVYHNLLRRWSDV